MKESVFEIPVRIKTFSFLHSHLSKGRVEKDAIYLDEILILGNVSCQSGLISSFEISFMWRAAKKGIATRGKERRSLAGCSEGCSHRQGELDLGAEFFFIGSR